jgi:hypothetical protein
MTEPMDERMIRVWRFEDAPPEYQELSPHGGDEDWVAYVPAALAEECIDWLDSGTAFGRCETSAHPFPCGTVYIGAHA